jgi:hypothetical protein
MRDRGKAVPRLWLPHGGLSRRARAGHIALRPA